MIFFFKSKYNNIMKQLLIFFKNYLLFFILIIVSLLLATNKFSYAVISGVKLWYIALLPSFLPYLFITTLLSELDSTYTFFNKFSSLSKKLFKVNGSSMYALFMSLISGYPMGAMITSKLVENKAISVSEGQRVSVLASTSSPAFTIGVVGSTIFNDIKFGVLLFIVNVLSTVTVAFFISRKSTVETPDFNYHFGKTKSSFYDVTYSSVISILVIGGIISIFYLICEILYKLNVFYPIIYLFDNVFNMPNFGESVCFGLLEFTRGISTLKTCTNSILIFPTACFFVSFSGLSCIIQSLAYLKKAKIKPAPFILCKIISGVISFIFGLLISLLISF